MPKSLVGSYTPFKISSEYKPAGDQVVAIDQLLKGLTANEKNQVLLGVTGSGKTFTMANVIERSQRPAVIMVHNKTLAAQIYGEMKSFFPNNAVEYFVSYYDYYQPEAYIAKTNTYIEKDSMINEQIDLMRHSATISLLKRRDTIIVTSVSSIYGLGDPEIYGKMIIPVKQGANMTRDEMINKLIALQYRRNDIEFVRGNFRVRGDTVDIFPSYSDEVALRVEFFGEEIEEITEIDGLTGAQISLIEEITIYPNAHYATPISTVRLAAIEILKDLDIRVKEMREMGKIMESDRLFERTKYDVEMMLETGSCKGIENYSRYIDGRAPGSSPYTLFHYLAQDAILFVDESHVSVPQIRAMYAGDRSRKTSLVEHGFRLPSAMDNRPLTFEEWDGVRPQTIFVSATPAPFEVDKSQGVVVRQVIRPTGLLDPICEVRPVKFQVDDIVSEAQKMTVAGMRTIVITLTKKMAENLHDYFGDIGVRSRYMHSDTDTLERIKIINMLRAGEIDVIVGINLLREGLDVPECGLVAIMDADKEGFLRSESSLIQIIGRAARNSAGKVILYADKITGSIKKAMDITSERRKLQEEYNIKNNITPLTIKKAISKSFDEAMKADTAKKELNKPANKKIATMVASDMTIDEIEKKINVLRKEMNQAAKNLEYERAAQIRDEVNALSKLMLTL